MFVCYAVLSYTSALPDVKAAYLLTACSGIFLSLTIEASTPDMQERGVQAIVEETSLELSILCQIIGKCLLPSCL